MNEYKEVLDYFWKFYNENAIEGSMLFRHYLDKLRELVDKETPKKPISEYQFGYPTKKYKCICGNYVNKITHNYCNKCGIKIDWSEEDENR